MKDLEFLAEIIDQITDGDAQLVTNPEMDPVTLIHGDGGFQLEGNTTSELFDSFKELFRIPNSTTLKLKGASKDDFKRNSS